MSARAFKSAPIPLQKGDYELLATFRYALRQFLHFSEEQAAVAGLSPQQHQALLAIKGFPNRESVTVGELAERLQIRHHSAVGLIDRLVSNELLCRKQDPKDRRRVCVELTSHGTEVLEMLSISHREELRRLEPEFVGILQLLVGENLPLYDNSYF